ncbi:MAG TPA: ABC transporter ATP-binding protein [Thermoprotei archaeon]|nr:ABC transporter ATP-binding protein [Thermoprotei archaeon]
MSEAVKYVLEASELHKWFGNVHAVNNVSLKLSRGEILSIVGPNGAGKTTLLNLLSGIVKPDKGRVYVYLNGDRKDITGRSPYYITFLGVGRSFQIPNIFDGLTVRDNIRLSILTYRRLINRFNRAYSSFNDVEEEVEKIIEIFSLEDSEYRYGRELSHGERKKLDIALSFAQQPNILLLDEPTSGLTYSEKLEMVELIRSLRREREVSFIVVEHDLDVVREVSDMLMVMHEGSVLAYDEPDEVVKMSEVISAYLGGEVI